MRDTMAILHQCKDFQLEEENKCPHCTKKLEKIISYVNSTYYYCKSCGYDKDTVFKNIELEYILKDIQENILNVNEQMKIEITKKDKSILLCINDKLISTRDFFYDFVEKDIKNLRYVILDLIEDTLGEGKTKPFVNIKV